ncbi:MAG: hypothetical protein DRP27_03245 [Thermotogae bacterium]|nr:MAG: hypothetical protein DRP27_03245 [Thermotogota bacterium]
MNFTTVEKDQNYEKVKVVFSKEDVERAEGRLAAKLNREIELPGFRRGKVPKSILRIRFPEYFEKEIVDELVEMWLDDRSDGLLLDPKMLSEERNEDGITVELELHWEPEVELPDLGELKVKFPSKDSVLENIVESNLETLRKEKAILEPKEEEIEKGDLVRLRYKIVDKETGEVVREDQSTEVNVDALKWLEDALIGKKSGAKIDTFVVEEEAGEPRYKLQGVIEQVYRKILPELDDEFAAFVDEKYKTLDDLKADLRKSGEREYEDLKADVLPSLALKELVEASKLHVSDRTLELMVNEHIKRLKSEGKYEKAVENAGSEEELTKAIREELVEALKARLVPVVYGSRHDLSITEEEIAEFVEKMAPTWSTTPERAKKEIFSSKELFWKIVRNLYEQKVGAHVLQNIRVEEFDMNADNAENSQEETEGVPEEESEES